MVTYNILLTDELFEKQINNEKEEFEKIIQKAAKLNKELKIDSSLQSCNLFSYLLWNGYFSKDKTFRYQDFDIINERAKNVMLGYGCCRNIASLLSYYLYENNIQTEKIYTYFNPKRISITDEPKINRKVILEKSEEKEKKVFHVSNLVKDDEKCYVYDATNLCISRLKNDKIKMINGRGCQNINFDLLMSQRNVEKYKELSKKTYIKKEEFIKQFEDDIIFFKENENLLDAFYSDINEEIINVGNKIKSL